MKHFTILAVLFLAVAVLLMPISHNVAYADPENPNAPVDLVDVETWYLGFYGIPGNPGEAMKAWIETNVIQPGDHRVFVGIFDHQEFQWIGSINLS